MSSGAQLLLEGLARSCVPLIMALGFARLGRVAAATRHVVLLALFGWLLLLPLQLSVGPRWELNVLPGEPLSGAVTLPIDGLASLGTNDAALASAPRAAAARDSVRAPVGGVFDAVAAIYLAGCVLLLLVRFVAMLRIRRVVSRACPAPPLPLDMQGVRVLISRECSLPFVTGLLRRSIVLPASARGWSSGELAAVLLHERAHARRRDPLAVLLIDLGCAANWPNPLCWLAVRRARMLAELACDDAAVRAGAQPTDYAQLLVRLARATRGVRLLAVAPGVTGPSDLALRVQHLLQESPHPTAPRAVLCACGFVMLALGMLAGACVPASATNGFQGSVDRTYNISDGGTDVSRNRAGLQARWREGDRHAGVFVTGDIDLAAAMAGAPAARGAALVVMSEDGSGRLRVLAWPGAAIGNARWAVQTLAIAVDKFRDLGFDSTASLTPTPRASPAPSPVRYPGSTMRGRLPSFSTDPGARVIQAGWIERGQRTGLFVRGEWSADGEQIHADQPGSWLLLFAVDPRSGTLRRLLAAQASTGPIRVDYSENGENMPTTDETYRWAAEALRTVAHLKARAHR